MNGFFRRFLIVVLVVFCIRDVYGSTCDTDEMKVVLVDTTNVFNLLDEIAGSCSKNIAILIHEELPISTLTDAIMFAGKAGVSKDKVHFFIFFDGKKWMVKIPGFERTSFSTDPNIISKRIHN